MLGVAIADSVNEHSNTDANRRFFTCHSSELISKVYLKYLNLFLRQKHSTTPIFQLSNRNVTKTFQITRSFSIIGKLTFCKAFIPCHDWFSCVFNC